ncbi:MAG: DUF4145 domain-containing protein [Phenylobacterium sp.]|nr:DUF4145 domain-containing protein [Phenylobacterium sp.]
MPSRRCPHCRKEAAYSSDENTRRMFNASPRTLARFDICQNDQCGCAAVAIVDDESRVLEIYPSLEAEPDEILPTDVKTAFGEALKSLDEGIWNGCVTMCSRALDEATADLEAKGSSLFERIENLAETHRITPELSEWAHTGRLAANLGRHGAEKEEGEKKWNDETDAKEIIEFSKWFFRYVYVLPTQLKARRKRLEDDVAKQPPEHTDEAAEETPQPAPEGQ